MLLAENQAQLLHTSYLLLATLFGFCILLGILHGVGILGDFVNLVTRALRAMILWGFGIWKRALSWATWPLFLILGLAILFGGNSLSDQELHLAAMPFGAALLAMGVVTCLTFMYLSNERYQVSRGYKVFHDPQKGQELASDLLEHGDRVGFITLILSILFVILGFAQFNHAIYETFGESFYLVKERDTDIVYLDFVTFALIHLINIVDFLDVATTNNLLDLSYIKAKAFPIRMLVLAYKTFFSFVLLQQLFIALRQNRMIAETMTDFWSPHYPIHQRALMSLKQSGPDAIPALLGSLNRVEGLSREQQAEILDVLVEIGPSGVPNLLRYLNDDHGPTRTLAISALGRFRPESGIKRLQKLIDDPNESVRLHVVEAIGELGAALREREAHPERYQKPSRWRTLWPWRKEFHPVEQCIALLRKGLADQSLPIRIASVRGLGQIGPKAHETEMEILQLAGYDSLELKRSIVETLGKIEAISPTAMGLLRKALASEQKNLQLSAIQAAGSLKQNGSLVVAELVPLVTDTDDEIREAAVQAIAQIGQLTPEASQALLQQLHSSDNLIRARVVEAFGAIGATSDQTVQALVEAIRDESGRVRGKAIEAVGKLGQQAAAMAVPTLRQALQDRDNWVRALAAEALGSMGESAGDALPDLLQALSQPGNTMVRCKAAESIARLQREEARTALEQAATDVETDLRVSAIQALGKFPVITHSSRQTLINAMSDSSSEVQLAALGAILPFAKEWPELDPYLLRWVEENDDTLASKVVDAMGQRPATEAFLQAIRNRYSRHSNDDLDQSIATALGKFAEAAKPLGDILIYLAQTGEERVREAALHALAIVLPDDAGKAFVAALRDRSESIRKLGSAGLMQLDIINEEWIPTIVETLRDSNDQIRSNTASILSRRPEIPSDAVPLLIECVDSTHESLRLHTAIALRRVDSFEARAAMSKFLEDPTLKVRLLAAGSLMKEEDYQPIVRSIIYESLNHEHKRLRSIAVQLIDDSGENAAGVIDLLRECRDKESEADLLEQVQKILTRWETVGGTTSEQATPTPEVQVEPAIGSVELKTEN